MFGEQLKQLRQSNRLTQVDLAKEFDVSKQTISNWENEYLLPSVKTLLKIASYFSVSTDFLLGIDERKCIDVSNLTDTQIAYVRQMINDILK